MQSQMRLFLKEHCDRESALFSIPSTFLDALLFCKNQAVLIKTSNCYYFRCPNCRMFTVNSTNLKAFKTCNLDFPL